MNPSLPRRSALQWLGALGASLALPAQAQAAWPSKPPRMFVPYPAGGAPDGTARVFGEQIARILGTSVVVENRPGGSGLVGLRAMTAQAADAHTLVFVTSGHVTLSALTPQFDLLRETRLVTRLTNSPFGLVVHADSPYQTTQDLIRAIQAKPGTISYGSAGPGSPSHMAVEYMEEAIAGFNALHVPFKGAVESVTAILGKQIDFTVGVLGTLLPQIQSGKLRALGVTTPSRLALAPQIPTLAEGGILGYQYAAWGGICMHKDTPEAVVQRLHQALVEAGATEPVRSFIQKIGAVTDLTESPKAFVAATEKEIARERSIVKRLGMSAPG